MLKEDNYLESRNFLIKEKDNLNPLSPGVLDPGSYQGGGVFRTHSYILPFLGFFMPPSINVKPHIE